MWATFVEIFGQPWFDPAVAFLGILVSALVSAVVAVYTLRHRKRHFKIMETIARNTEPRKRTDEKPAEPPAPTRDPDEASRPPETAAASTSATEERPSETPVPPTRFTQRQFDEELRNTGSGEREDKRPAEPPAPTRRPNDWREIPAATRRPASAPEERPSETPVPPTRFTQRQFDGELRRLLREKKERGDGFAVIVSGDLHRRVVGRGGPNRMPMACNAMWKLWERQGRKKENVIHTTPSGRSSTIRIRYDLTDTE